MNDFSAKTLTIFSVAKHRHTIAPSITKQNVIWRIKWTKWWSKFEQWSDVDELFQSGARIIMIIFEFFISNWAESTAWSEMSEILKKKWRKTTEKLMRKNSPSNNADVVCCFMGVFSVTRILSFHGLCQRTNHKNLYPNLHLVSMLGIMNEIFKSPFIIEFITDAPHYSNVFVWWWRMRIFSMKETSEDAQWVPSKCRRWWSPNERALISCRDDSRAS